MGHATRSRDRSLNLKNPLTFTFHLILKNFSTLGKRTWAGDRPPDTALGAIALPSSKIAQLHLILKNFSSSCRRTCIGDRPPDTALSPKRTLHLERALWQPQKSPNFHLILKKNCKSFLDYVRALAQVIALLTLH
ncbi:hypothetical protein [Scytonema sp. HK-05]|uniref:hypothetical protein n=1 Tax=Scytonema sp. HK-05 TaxID=1137095 RepID=UPI000A878C1B|nr:hypothetical protein [Scytonema sp. HK-05]